MVGFASDGDTRLLSAMSYLITEHPNDTIVVQDPTHIGTKLRNRLLKMGISLPIGSYYVSVNHLKRLVHEVQKSVHGLAITDVCPSDRMNFESFRKITDERVIEALKKYVPGSEATVLYLKVCREVTSAYLALDLSPLDRVYRLFHGLYFFRIWRQHIRASRRLNLLNNFISSNAYTCIEINARTLIMLIKMFRDEGKPEHFLLALFDSQTCENLFRLLRSMGTLNYTKINFSLYDLLHLIGRTEVQNDIAYIKLANEDIFFPNKRKGKTSVYPLPNDTEIAETILKAKEAAINNAHDLGINQFRDIDHFDFSTNIVVQNEDSDNDEDSDHEEFCDMLSADENDDKTDAYTYVVDEDGIQRKIRKSTLVWMLTDPYIPLSKDRLRRFKSVQKSYLSGVRDTKEPKLN